MDLDEQYRNLFYTLLLELNKFMVYNLLNQDLIGETGIYLIMVYRRACFVLVLEAKLQTNPHPGQKEVYFTIERKLLLLDTGASIFTTKKTPDDLVRPLKEVDTYFCGMSDENHVNHKGMIQWILQYIFGSMNEVLV